MATQIKHISASIEGHLPRSLSSLETCGFGLTGHLVWIITAPAMHIALGPQAVFVWLPAVIVGMLLNLQVKRLGMQWPQVSGGTPNYITRLLPHYPWLGRYAAIAYFFSWAVIPSLNAIVLADVVKANLVPFGIACPDLILRFGFTALAFIVALGGTRALGILHSFFVLPAIGFLLVFCLQGLGWLTFSSTSPGLLPTEWPAFNFVEWAKWFFFAVYATYACETASSFVADSQKPSETLRFLSLSAWLIPVVYLGGSWVLMQLDTGVGLDDSPFSHLLAAAKFFWGPSASLFVTLLIASSCLLSCATAFSNSPRVLYQLALDRQAAPVFSVVSRQGVLGPSLILTFAISLLFLAWGNVSEIIVIGGAAYMVPMIVMHLGLWLQRRQPEVRWPWWSLGFFIVELVVLAVGGLAWSWQDIVLGLLAPVVIWGVDLAIRGGALPCFQTEWWLRVYNSRYQPRFKDFVAVQVIVIIALVCCATTVGWTLSKLGRGPSGLSTDLLVVVLMTISFGAIAIACWTSLPQVAAIAEAREHAETLFMTALDTVPDTILVLDEVGVIRQANPSAEKLLHMSMQALVTCPLSQFFAALDSPPAEWPSRSEQTLITAEHQSVRIIESTVSQRSSRNLQEYIVILRDITERKQAEANLREALQVKEELVITATTQAQQLQETLQDLRSTQAQLIQTEKMSSLGQLVAGVAHEINNPVNFIYGNLTHVGGYTQDLIELIALYQQQYPHANPAIQTQVEEIELDFLVSDLPKTLSSMKLGADRIRQIVLTLRNFSRLDEADMKPVNIHEGMESTLLILQSRLKAKPERPAIQITKLYGDLPEVECYAGQLNQVFMNLLNNAIDALNQYDNQRSIQDIKDNPSTITISTQTFADGWVGIAIKDNGPGMNNAVRDKLFDPFFTTKPIGEGTGLGLSISYQIVVEKHGGHLKCTSQPGQGAEFHIQIPIKQKLLTKLVTLST